MVFVILLFIEQKKRSKYLVQEAGARKTFRLSSHTPRIQFSVLSRTGLYHKIYDKVFLNEVLLFFIFYLLFIREVIYCVEVEQERL